MTTTSSGRPTTRPDRPRVGPRSAPPALIGTDEPDDLIDHTPICVTDDHDYTIINIRQMNGHQTPLIKCERCDTVWHNHTPAQRGDLIFIPTHEPPTDEHLTAISELADTTGVMILFVNTELEAENERLRTKQNQP